MVRKELTVCCPLGIAGLEVERAVECHPGSLSRCTGDKTARSARSRRRVGGCDEGGGSRERRGELHFELIKTD